MPMSIAMSDNQEHIMLGPRVEEPDQGVLESRGTVQCQSDDVEHFFLKNVLAYLPPTS